VNRFAIAASTALAAGVLVAPAVAASPAAAPSMVRVAGNVLPSLDRLASRQADPQQRMTVGVALAHPHPAAEAALINRLYTPGNPDFGHYLTAAQAARRFGVPAARTNNIVARLRAAGLHVRTPDAFGDYVSARGTVTAIERAFHLTIRRFTASAAGLGTVHFLANTTAPLVPAADHITTVVGLNTLQRFSTAQDTCLNGTCTGLTTPQDLWQVYDQPSRHTGHGVRMAIIGEGNASHLQQYLKQQETTYRLPQTKLNVVCVQGSCGKDTSGDGEWEIDTQASAGMAPGNAGLTLYFAKSILDGDLNNSFVRWAHAANGPKLASASLGECEASPANGVFNTPPLSDVNGNTSGGTGSVLAFGNGEQAAIDPVLRSAVLQGKTLFASTGDTGSSCPLFYLPAIGAGNGLVNQGNPEQNYPAVSVSTVAVGGTVLYTSDNGSGAGASYKPANSATSRVLETAWSFGGGGASLWTPEPAWQRSVSAIDQPCVVPTSGSPGATCRGVPDVSAQSGDVLTNGYSIYGSGGFSSGGGTSLSSPLWMGMWARVQGAAGRNLGFAAPLIYRSAGNAKSYARDFFDITIGSNGLHPATSGWDYTTGWGVPKVAGLIADVAKR
jgi:subtilase family serine protease